MFIRLFCAPNSALAAFFAKLSGESIGEQDAILGFIELFPNRLGTWSESPVRRENDLLRLAEDFTLRGLNQPERYRGIYDFVHDYHR